MSELPDPDKTYEQICRQIDRETLLHRARMGTCLLLNAGLGTGASSQIGLVENSTISLIIVVICCVVGFLVTEGFLKEMRAGWAQAGYLYYKFNELEQRHPGRFINPYFEPKPETHRIPNVFTDIPSIFQCLWIFTLVFSMLLRFHIVRL